VPTPAAIIITSVPAPAGSADSETAGTARVDDLVREDASEEVQGFGSGGVSDSYEAAHRGMITVSIMLATVIQAIDGTIANVALPHMQGNLSASQDQITWVLTSYIVAAGIATPLTGWLTDRFGLKQVFLVSIAGFTGASVLCGVAGSLAQIVLARVLQGFLGAALVPLSQAVLLDINPRERHGTAMAMFGVGVMVGPILGPALGGYLTENFNWRWVFFINVPIGSLAFYGVGRYIRRRTPARRVSFDLFGFTTLSLAVGALMLLLNRGEQNDWFGSTESWVEAVIVVASTAYFVTHTALTPIGKSFLDLRLLKNANFVSGTLLMFFVGAIVFSTRALLPTMLQDLLDYPVSLAGLVTAPSGIGTMLAMMVAGRFVGRVDALAAGDWLRNHDHLAVADAAIQPRNHPGRHHLAGRGAGDRHGSGVRPPDDRDLRHSRVRDARRRYGNLQSVPQHRQRRRHRRGERVARAQYADRPRRAGRKHRRRKQGSAAWSHGVGFQSRAAGRSGADRRHGHEGGGDDRLYR
jgi:MFS family permease